MRRVLVAIAAVSAAMAWDRRARRPAEPTVDAAAGAEGGASATSSSAGETRTRSRPVVAALTIAIASVLAGSFSALPSVPADSPVPATATVAPPAPGPIAAGAEPAPPPVQIDIPHIGVSAPVDEVGLLDDGTMAVPEQFERTGWYGGLEAPGESGTAAIVGHLDSHTGPGVFARLPELRGGEEIIVTRADGSTVTFVVQRTEQYDKDKFPTIAVYSPTAEPSLRLITCGGDYDRRRRHYHDNVVVYAHSQETA